MGSGLYEQLGVAPEAEASAIRAAYQEQVAQVVRRLRGAEARQQDTTPLEARRSSLAEAYAVLSDPARRRRYDRFREVAATGFPADIDELWRVAGPSMVDPSAAAALEVLRMLTGLRVGDSIGTVEVVASALEPELELEPTVPDSAIEPLSALSPAVSPPAPRQPRTAAPPLEMDRGAPAEEMRRLFDVYGPTGAFFAAVRELRRLDLEGLSNASKINRRFLEGIETESFGGLPAAAFVRGYLRTLVRLLEIPANPAEPDEVVEGYMARFHRARG